ncbi:hypothetical protein GCM10018781_03650 [Kitasatospora indigofera]|uniref:Uncharacterized protein n=1 Tax=Kitasatospora indigofera TaxID=67307 RepID=A0A919FBR2_9ACTN|nr:hypothetical protein [Kitasatospora indigofera]GHH59798.1 hypothetical protein GCM10018781_03650 [Kitasatospora indigofera]
MTDDHTPADVPADAPRSAIERRQQLLETIRRDGGAFDWRRARETYRVYPDPRLVRRDLEQLRKAGLLVRLDTGEYQAG